MLICSLNVNSLLKHKPEIEVLLHDNNIDKCQTDTDGYHHERFDRNRHEGGVCVYVKNTVN